MKLKTRDRLDRYSSGITMTPAEFDTVENYDRRYRYELIKGVVIVSPIESIIQASPNEELGYLLRYYKYHHPQGGALNDSLPNRYIRLPNTRRLADRVIWAGLERVPDEDLDSPTIAAEFVSRRKRDHIRDYEEKRREYPAAGVKEYWIIDPFKRILTVCSKKRGKIVDRVFQEDEVYRTELLPGFELPLRRLLDLAEAYEKQRAKRKKK